jgi:hypothetical protein
MKRLGLLQGKRYQDMAKKKVIKTKARALKKSKPVKKGAIKVIKKGVNFLDITCEKGFHPETVIDKGVVTVHCVPNA